MVVPTVDVNYLAVAVAALAGFVIGAVWYTPSVFGNAWMKANGFTRKSLEKKTKKGDMPKAFLMQYVGLFLAAWVIAWTFGAVGHAGISEGLMGAFWLWLGFLVPAYLGSVAWEMKPWSYFFIQAGHWLVVLLVMGMILVSWV